MIDPPSTVMGTTTVWFPDLLGVDHCASTLFDGEEIAHDGASGQAFGYSIEGMTA